MKERKPNSDFQFQVIWQDRMRQPQHPFDRAHPWGVAIDATAGQLPACLVNLEWPALRCGEWLIACNKCGMRVLATTAGRVDDPCSVRIPCQWSKAIDPPQSDYKGGL